MSQRQHSTVEDVLVRRADALIGRERPLATLLELLESDERLVAYVHGIAGAGKSTLLRAFVTRARSRGAAVITLDAAAVEPTEQGLETALSRVLPGAPGSPQAIRAALGDLGDRVVLVLDRVERLRLLDDALRRTFIPSLPLHVRVVLASRERPDPAWTAAYGELLAQIELGGLTATDAEHVLRELGVAVADTGRVNRVARGHPLALRLAAAALAARPDAPLDDVATAAVADELAGMYVAGLDAGTRRALDAAALVRRPTRSVLRDMLPDADADEAFTRLEALPFVELGADGLVLHETVRDAVDAALRASDPERRRTLRAAAYRHVRSGLRTAPATDLWRWTADMLHLIDNPLIRDGFFPPAGRRYAVEPAARQDARPIAAIVGRHEPAPAAALVRDWLSAVPDAFRVARDRQGDVAGVIAVCEPGSVPTRLLDRDPLAALWREDLRRRPIRRDERVLFTRCLLSHEQGEGPGPAQAALWVDAKRAYMELRPHLRRMYVAYRRPEIVAPMLEPLGFQPLDGVAVIGDQPYRSLCLDFGPGSVDGWLGALVAAELDLDDEPLLDRGGRRLMIAGRRIVLTELEAGLVAYLWEREGQAVRRADLLRDVWGDEWQAGSNVVEVAVSGLRRKLGEDASLIETVRGVGYRLRAP